MPPPTTQLALPPPPPSAPTSATVAAAAPPPPPLLNASCLGDGVDHPIRITSYIHGDIVWIKLTNSDIWWPGAVTNERDHLYNALTRPFAVVKFFQEHKYDHARSSRSIRPFQCEQKSSLIQRTRVKANRRKLGKQFEIDRAIAEYRTTGVRDPDVLNAIDYPEDRSSDNDNNNHHTTDIIVSNDNLAAASAGVTAAATATATATMIIQTTGSVHQHHRHHEPINHHPESAAAGISQLKCTSCDFNTNSMDILMVHRRANHRHPLTIDLDEVGGGKLECSRVSNCSTDDEEDEEDDVQTDGGDRWVSLKAHHVNIMVNRSELSNTMKRQILAFARHTMFTIEQMVERNKVKKTNIVVLSNTTTINTDTNGNVGGGGASGCSVSRQSDSIISVLPSAQQQRPQSSTTSSSPLIQISQRRGRSSSPPPSQPPQSHSQPPVASSPSIVESNDEPTNKHRRLTRSMIRRQPPPQPPQLSSASSSLLLPPSTATIATTTDVLMEENEQDGGGARRKTMSATRGARRQRSSAPNVRKTFTAVTTLTPKSRRRGRQPKTLAVNQQEVESPAVVAAAVAPLSPPPPAVPPGVSPLTLTTPSPLLLVKPPSVSLSPPASPSPSPPASPVMELVQLQQEEEVEPSTSSTTGYKSARIGGTTVAPPPLHQKLLEDWEDDDMDEHEVLQPSSVVPQPPPPLPPSTVVLSAQRDARNRIRNIPKKDRRDVVLQEFELVAMAKAAAGGANNNESNSSSTSSCFDFKEDDLDENNIGAPVASTATAATTSSSSTTTSSAAAATTAAAAATTGGSSSGGIENGLSYRRYKSESHLLPPPPPQHQQQAPQMTGIDVGIEASTSHNSGGGCGDFPVKERQKRIFKSRNKSAVQTNTTASSAATAAVVDFNCITNDAKSAKKSRINGHGAGAGAGGAGLISQVLPSSNGSSGVSVVSNITVISAEEAQELKRLAATVKEQQQQQQQQHSPIIDATDPVQSGGVLILQGSRTNAGLSSLSTPSSSSPAAAAGAAAAAAISLNCLSSPASPEEEEEQQQPPVAPEIVKMTAHASSRTDCAHLESVASGSRSAARNVDSGSTSGSGPVQPPLQQQQHSRWRPSSRRATRDPLNFPIRNPIISYRKAMAQMELERFDKLYFKKGKQDNATSSSRSSNATQPVAVTTSSSSTTTTSLNAINSGGGEIISNNEQQQVENQGIKLEPEDDYEYEPNLRNKRNHRGRKSTNKSTSRPTPSYRNEVKCIKNLQRQQHELDLGRIYAVLTKPIPDYGNTFMLGQLVGPNKFKKLNSDVMQLSAQHDKLVALPSGALAEPAQPADGQPLIEFIEPDPECEDFKYYTDSDGEQTEILNTAEWNTRGLANYMFNDDEGVGTDESTNHMIDEPPSQPPPPPQSPPLPLTMDPHGFNEYQDEHRNENEGAVEDDQEGGVIGEDGGAGISDVDADADIDAAANLVSITNEENDEIDDENQEEEEGDEDEEEEGDEEVDEEEGEVEAEVDNIEGGGEEVEDFSQNTLAVNIRGHDIHLDPIMLMSIAQHPLETIELVVDEGISITLPGAEVLQAANQYLKERGLELVNMDAEVDGMNPEAVLAEALAATTNQQRSLAASPLSASTTMAIDDFVDISGETTSTYISHHTSSTNNTSDEDIEFISQTMPTSALHLIQPPPSSKSSLSTNETNTLIGHHPIMSAMVSPNPSTTNTATTTSSNVAMDDTLGVFGIPSDENATTTTNSLDLPITITNPAIASRTTINNSNNNSNSAGVGHRTINYQHFEPF